MSPTINHFRHHRHHHHLYLQLTIAVILSLSFVSNEVKGECSELLIRRNFLSLSSSELSEYISVFRQMYSKGIFEQLAAIHANNFQTIHDSPQFLVWHRYFLWDFEQQMRSINPKLTLPYWDGAADFYAPHESKVFSPQAFGGNGDPNNRNCLHDGFLSLINISYPQYDCLKRRFNGRGNDTIDPWHSPVFITSLIQTSPSFDDFRANLEHTLHNSIHFGVGGDFGQSYSPVDALFFLHHANIDRIYTKWQLSQPFYLDAIDGYQLTSFGTRIPISPSFQLDHYNIRVGDLLRTVEEPLCYTYDDIADQKFGLTNKVENRLRQLPRQLLKRYFPKFLSTENNDDEDDESSVDHDFPNARSLSMNLNRPLPTPLALPIEWFERRGFNTTRAIEIRRRAQQFIEDMNARRFPVRRRNLKW